MRCENEGECAPHISNSNGNVEQSVLQFFFLVFSGRFGASLEIHGTPTLCVDRSPN